MANVPLSELYNYWDALGNVRISSDNKLEVHFLHFKPGTSRDFVWRWFEEQNPKFLCGEVMKGIRHEEGSIIDRINRDHMENQIHSGFVREQLGKEDFVTKGWLAALADAYHVMNESPDAHRRFSAGKLNDVLVWLATAPAVAAPTADTHLGDLVGVLLRADKDKELSDTLYREGISDAYEEVMNGAISHLATSEALPEILHRYEAEVPNLYRPAAGLPLLPDYPASKKSAMEM
jgi:hypothetical protein